MRTRAAILYELGLPQPYAQSRPLKIEELEFDSPGFGEVGVKIASAGLCHSDLSNLTARRPANSAPRRRSIPMPATPGTQIRDALGILGVDVAIEATAHAPVVLQALASTAPCGTAIALGITNPATTVPIPPRDIPTYIGLWRSGKLPIERLLSGTIGLEGLNEAFDRLAAGEVIRTMCIA